MPTYEYLCRQCGDQFEIFQSFRDDALTVHDACGGALRKVFHARGVVFKGSGFYVTDSRQPNPANGTSSQTSGSDKPSGNDKPLETKSDGKRSSKSSEPKPAAAE